MRLIKNLNGNGIADTCEGRQAGDGNCEQACGADAKCDELNTGNFCGTNGRCTTNCSCCEPSDSDGGRVYTVKGTTTGYEPQTEVCLTFTDYCKDDKILVEYYTTDTEYSHELYDCSQRTDGLVHCVDGRCGCLYDSDCPPGGTNNLVKGKCDSPSGTDNPDTSGYTYTCYWPACTKNDECVDNYCCDKDPAIPAADQGSGTCNWGPSSSSRIYKINIFVTHQNGALILKQLQTKVFLI